MCRWLRATGLIITNVVDEELIVTIVEMVFPSLENGVYFHAGEGIKIRI